MLLLAWQLELLAGPPASDSGPAPVRLQEFAFARDLLLAKLLVPRGLTFAGTAGGLPGAQLMARQGSSFGRGLPGMHTKT